ncbi:HMG-box, partial [Peniophora sp. CONT]
DATPVKRRRAIKDPDAPKRPASSYLLFQNDIRSQLRVKHPEMTHHEIMTRVSQLWASLPPEEKEVYEKKHAGMKVDYETRKAAYEHTKNGTTPAEVAP